jgi:hypothetical protein
MDKNHNFFTNLVSLIYTTSLLFFSVSLTLFFFYQNNSQICVFSFFVVVDPARSLLILLK